MYGGPVNKHLDDVTVHVMSRFRYPRGRTAACWEERVETFRQSSAFWSKRDSGAMATPHGHHGDVAGPAARVNKWADK